MAGRGSQRIVMTALLAAGAGPAAAVSLAVPQAVTAATLQAPASRSAVPGELVTLIYILRGEGHTTLEVGSPPGWEPLTPRAQLTLQGMALCPVTFRVPPRTPAGEQTITVRASTDAQAAVSASATLNVLPQSQVKLSSPPQLDAAPGVFVRLPVEVVNTGNRRDTFDLRLTNRDGLPQLSAPDVTLDPGEGRSVSVTLLLNGVSPEYRYTVGVEAVPRLDPSALARTRSEVVVHGQGHGSGTLGTLGPSIAVRLRSALEAAYQQDDHGQRLGWSYSLEPSASGQLSDSVEGTAGAGGLDGTSDQPLPRGVSASVRLGGETWSAQLDAGTFGARVAADLRLGEWTLTPRAQYQALQGGQRFGAGLNVSGPLAGGELQLGVGSEALTLGGESVRSDSAGARFARSLNDQLSFSVAASGQGVQRAGSYGFGALAAQQLTYSSGTFDVTQSYSVASGGLQSLGVSGGLRSAAPIGLRAAASVQLSPGAAWYGVSGLAFLSGAQGAGVSLGGRYQFGGGGLADRATPWELNAALRVPDFSFGVIGVSATLSAALRSDDHQPQQTASHLGLALEAGGGSAASGALTGSAQADYRHDWTAAGQERQQLAVGASRRYVLGEDGFDLRLSASRTALGSAQSSVQSSADAALPQAQNKEAQTTAVQTTETQLSGSWERQWTPQLRSTLEFSQGWTGSEGVAIGASSRTSLGVGLNAQDLFVPGLGLSAGYRVGRDSALSQPYSQALRVGLSYDLAVAFATPPAVVQAFGGLKGSDVSGVLYRDDNLNGTRDAGEPGLAGVTVQAGSASTVTDAEGRYSLRVSGRQTLSFPGGLSAALEPLGEVQTRQLDGVVNTTLRRDIGFAAVGNAELMTYQDTNRDGQRGDDEPPLPYVSVRFSGPVQRTVQADGRGLVHALLPLGQYTASLEPQSLPAGMQAVAGSPLPLVVGDGVPPGTPPLALGAALPQRQAVVSYSGGSHPAAVLAQLDSGTASPGDTVRLQMQLQGVQSLRVQALGQEFAPGVQGDHAELSFVVPSGSPPGAYDVQITAAGEGGERVSHLRLLVPDVGGVQGP